MSHRIFILGSVAGGVGKTAVGVNLLSCLAMAGKDAVLIDTSPLGTLSVLSSKVRPRGGPRLYSPATSSTTPASPQSVCPFPCFSSDDNGLFPCRVTLPESLLRVLLQLSKSRDEGRLVMPPAPSIQSEPNAGASGGREATKALQEAALLHVSAPRDKDAPSEEPYIIVDCASTIDMLMIAEHAGISTCMLVARPRESEKVQLGTLLASADPGHAKQAVKDGTNGKGRRWRIVVNGYDASDSGQLEVLATMEREFPGRLCRSGIPDDPAVASAFEKGLSVVVAAPASRAAVTFTRLARELFGTLQQPASFTQATP